MELLVYFGAMPVVCLIGWHIGMWGKANIKPTALFSQPVYIQLLGINCAAIALLAYTAAMLYFTRGW